MKDGLQLHHIQKGIILSLASQKKALRFTDLQPPRVPNNTFSYHLKRLVDTGYVDPVDGGYIAARKALKLIAYEGSRQEGARPSPVPISMIYITNEDDEILLINRDTKPFQGWYGLPSGVIHRGETLQQAAKRELLEKTGIGTDKDLRLAGIMDFAYEEAGTKDVFTHAIAFVYTYKFSGDRKEINDHTTKYGQLSWSKFGRKHILPEVHAARELVENQALAIKSVDFVEPAHMPILALD